MRQLSRHTPRQILALPLVLLLSLAACGAGSAGEGEPAAQAKPEVGGGATTPEELPHPPRIAFGEEVDLADHLVEGQTTVFDFTSDYCGPCVQFSPWLNALHASRDDIHVVKVDVNRPQVRGIDFGSPVARQYRIQSLPHFRVYDPEGTLVADGMPARKMVVDWLIEMEKAGVAPIPDPKANASRGG